MHMVVREMLTKQITYYLAISEATVKIHRGHVMRKTRATSVVDLCEWASPSDQLNGIVNPDSRRGAGADTRKV